MISDAVTEFEMTKATVSGSIDSYGCDEASFLLSTQPDLSDAKEFEAEEEGYIGNVNIKLK